jgi:acetyl esterase
MSVQPKLPVMELVSAQMAAVVAKSAQLNPPSGNAGGSLDQARAAYVAERAYWNDGGPQVVGVYDQAWPTRHGQVPIRAYLPGPVPVGGWPTMVYLHGGGYVLGNLDTHDRIMRSLGVYAHMAVVGVDYTLSPEAKFPVALEQAVDVVAALATNGSSLGLNPDKLVLAGDSAGAQLAMGVALLLRDTGFDTAKVKAVLAYYGLYGLRDSVSRRFLGGPWDGLTGQDLAYYLEAYLAKPEDQASRYVDILSADLARGIPPCYLAAAQFDPLRDDTAALAMALKLAGIEHRLELFDGVLHGFLHHSRMLDAAVTALEQGAQFAHQAVYSTNNQS